MPSRENKIATGIISASALVGSFVGLGFGNQIQTDDERRFAEAPAQISELEEVVLQDDLNLDRTISRLGEGCVNLVENYLPSGPLADTPEDTVVSDLLNSRTQPCGSDATEVRVEIRDYFTKQEELDTDKNTLEGLRADLPRLEQHAKDDYEERNYVLLGLAGGVVVGLALSVDLLKD